MTCVCSLGVSSHCWNNHNHKHKHKRFGQFLAKKFEIYWWFVIKGKIQYHKHIVKSQTYCDITNLLWYSKTDCQISQTYCEFQKSIGNQTNKYNCPVFTQTGRKTIGMWTFVKLQQVDVFKTMLIQKKQCSAQLSQAQPIELEFLKKLTN